MGSRMTAKGGRVGLEGLSKKEKGLMDMDSSAEIAGMKGYKEKKW